MKQLNEHHSFTGMQRDMSISKHPSSFLYDAHNIRLTARGEDTLLTITNERGPSVVKKSVIQDNSLITTDVDIQVTGTYLGHCLLGKYLVVFSTYITTPPQSKPDYITRIDLSTKEVVVLYNGKLNFDPNYKIEAVASYENELIQKVYWTDGYNQPRLINIAGDIKENVDNQFNFVRDLKLQEQVTIKKQLESSGSFAPGVIQYAFTYYNKHGQESNIFYISPLLYISHKDRGGSPEDKVENAFRISVRNLDDTFDYLRIYSIQRTSLNATPIVKRIQDIAFKEVDLNQEEGDNIDYVNSFYYNPVVVSNNNIINKSTTHDYIGEYPMLPSQYGNKTWYGYSKANYPDLVVMAKDVRVTWGEESDSNSIIWVSEDQYSYDNNYGYKVCQTTDNTGFTLIPLKEYVEPAAITFLDTGTTGDSVDPIELLYKGGESISVQTIEQKDNTLFLGNIELQRKFFRKEEKENIVSNIRIEQDTRTFYPMKVTSAPYIYSNQLSATDAFNTYTVPCGGFKRGDYYRCGVQFQYKDGRWSDPIFIGDIQVTNKPLLHIDTDASTYGHTETIETEEWVQVPTLKGILGASAVSDLYSLGYRKARAVVVFPEPQDRVVLCQGVICPTMYTNNTKNKLWGQSSWFFRPIYGSDVVKVKDDGSVAPSGVGDTLLYTSGNTENNLPTWSNMESIRSVEIQGDFYSASDNNGDLFIINKTFSTFHSPDIEFDSQTNFASLAGIHYKRVGRVNFTHTLSDINIKMETPPVSSLGGGFVHKSFIEDGPQGIVSGLFYEDFAINYTTDNGGKFMALNQNSPYKWVVYPWNKSGSLNNDVNRASDKGTRTSELKEKVISNLRFTNTTYDDTIDNSTTAVLGTPQIFNSDQVTIVKVDNRVYQGNVDTSLSPNNVEGMYFAFGESAGNLTNYNAGGIVTPFTIKNQWWKISSKDRTSINASTTLFMYRTDAWSLGQGANDSTISKNMLELSEKRELVRMKYKSTPHMVLNSSSSNANTMYDALTVGNTETLLPIIELIRPGDTADSNLYRATMFGGISEDALKANQWIPCGEPVSLVSGSNAEFKYSYGDTYFQRWDCLKTYPFTFDDLNQIVEIGSFMLETRCNIDGRYDRNRGQVSNLTISPTNFNLFNPVYNQINNFFTYRILDEDYYNIRKFSNQITWTKEKQAGADVDLWTNITLASTYDMDGSKGEVRSLQTWKDNIYCFQDLGISTILFNSRVQIPTSDGVPIEITNSYKVDGYRYISDGIGCKNKWSISNVPSGIYFADTKNNHLFHVGDQMQDITTVHNMTSWFNDINHNLVQKTLYDDVNHDLYVLTGDTALCYSEILGNFTSFMNYEGALLLESYDNHVYTMNDTTLYTMFEGEPNNFFGTQKGWDFTFVSNGIENNLMDFDKIFTNIDYRMDMSGEVEEGEEEVFKRTLDYIQVSNEYQDTGIVPLSKTKVTTTPFSIQPNLQKKFRIWRIQIPRDKKSTKLMDRIRNTWCKIKLGSKGEDNLKAILHDLNVQYYL